jgi:hypothetical protein
MASENRYNTVLSQSSSYFLDWISFDTARTQVLKSGLGAQNMGHLQNHICCSKGRFSSTFNMVSTWQAIRPWWWPFWSNNRPILIRKILYYGGGSSKLNVGVTRMWKYLSWDFHGHRHCLPACSCGKLPKVPVLTDTDKNNRWTDK